MREIALTKGFVAIVDDDDYDQLITHKWKAHVGDEHHIYAVRSFKKGGRNGIWIAIQMHRVVTHAGPGIVVDHINGNTLDNRKENLRACEQKYNAMNRRSHMGKTCRFKGVHLDKKSGLWVAAIRKDKHRNCLGYFDRDIDAALAYNIAAVEMFGAFASLNDPSLLEGATPQRRIPRHDGVRNGRAKLSSEAVQLIRTSDERTDVLAERFGVHKSTIIRARNGSGWKGLEA
jgi:hypothetical protein